MLAVSPIFDSATNTLTVNMTDSDNSVHFEFAVFTAADPADPPTLGIRMSSSSSPQDLVVPSVFTINVRVTNPAVAGGNRASFGIVPFDSAFDLSSFVFEGNGTTGSGYFACETSEVKSTAAINLSFIDVVSFSQADEIRLDGTFSNDTGNATVEVAYQSFEPDASEVILGTNRPLEADFIRVESSKSIVFFNPVSGTQDVTLRTADVLNLDYDVTAGRTLVLDGTGGVTQVASSQLVAPTLEVVNRSTTAAAGGDGDLILGTATNDFDEIRITSETEGRVAIRDVDDLVIGEYGIRAPSGQAVVETVGQLTIDSTIRAAGFYAHSDTEILSTTLGSMELGDLGLGLYASSASDASATGNITLNAPVRIQQTDLTTLVNNKLVASGNVTVAGGFYSPFAGSTKFSGKTGVVVGGPVQAGSSQLDASSTKLTVYDHDLILVSDSGAITVNDAPGNAAVPRTIQATNIVSFDAAQAVTIAGSVYAGTPYGNILALPTSEALPAITIAAGGAVNITATGSLQTSSYENNADTHPNPAIGLITITEASQVNHSGVIAADGPVSIGVAGGVSGDIFLNGSVTGRETVNVRTTMGSVGVQGPVSATGWTYTTTLPIPANDVRIPNVILSAPLGAISTTGLGTLSAGQLVNGSTTTYGEVRLNAQQNIAIGADVDTKGGFSATTTLGGFQLEALLRTGGDQSATIAAANGIEQLEGGRIVTTSLDVVNSTSGDITLLEATNRISKLAARNLAVGGRIDVANESAITVDRMRALGDVTLASGGTATVVGVISSQTGDITLESTHGNLDFTAAGAQIYAPAGSVTLFTPNGTVLSPPTLNASAGVTIVTFGGLTIANPLSSSGGSIDLESRNGAITIDADIFAAERITLDARTGITQGAQRAVFLRAEELVVTNRTNAAVTLNSFLNNVAYVSATTLGGFTYYDADDFETGVNRSGVLGVEISADTINLQSQAAKSIIRVVSGLRYRSLSISAGVAGSSNPDGTDTFGTVEFVVTSESDNPAFGAAFRGSMRDMVTYVNANRATVLINGSNRPVRMQMVFDEAGYAVDEATVTASLPFFTNPVIVDGSRLEASLVAGGLDRVGVKGTTTAVNGLAFGQGSAGSFVTNVAAYGFSRGSSLVLTSGGNTVENSWFGIKANGTAAANRTGVEIYGVGAARNQIGNDVFDTNTANRFGNNTAGIVVRDGASGTRIVGNVVGRYGSIGAPNTDGIRVNAANGTQIGDIDTVQWDLKPGISNVIAGNATNGVLVMKTRPGGYQAANVVRNNHVSGNGAGITLSDAQFTVIGGLVERASNVVVSQRTSGVRVNASTDVKIIDNDIGIDPRGVDQTDILAGNGLDGIEIGDLTQRVEIAEGNRIGGNGRHGISISGLQTRGVSVTKNTIGGLLDDGRRAGNRSDGVAIIDAIGNTVSGGNVVSFNYGNGVSVTNASAQTLARGNRVLSNRIAFNDGDGVKIRGGARSTIGGTGATHGNVFQQNANGIVIEYSNESGAPTGHAIQGNFVGTTRARGVATAFGNLGAGIRITGGIGNTVSDGNAVMNNAASGVELRGGSTNVIGSETAGKANLISGNAVDGVNVAAATTIAPAGRRAGLDFARAHVIQGNDISDNRRDGVFASGTQVNGITVGQSVTASAVKGIGNVIAGNGRFGVVVDAGAQRVGVQGNSIADNVAGGVWVAPDANRSSFTTLDFQRVGGTPAGQTAVLRPLSGGRNQLEVYGRLTGQPNQQYSIEIYTNDPYAGTGVPQLRRFIGRVTVTANAAGVVDFSTTPLRITTTALEVGESISMTATSLRFEAGSTKVSSSLATVELPGIRNPTF